jgi:putative DNA primase/helicase
MDLAANQKPMIKGIDYSIWRRIILILFITRIAEKRQDKYLDQRLMWEGPRILN